jgi:hypothetical protein
MQGIRGWNFDRVPDELNSHRHNIVENSNGSQKFNRHKETMPHGIYGWAAYLSSAAKRQ